MRWVVYVARMETGKLHKEFWLGDLRERNHLQDPDIDGRIVFLKRIFKKGENNNIYLLQLGCYQWQWLLSHELN